MTLDSSVSVPWWLRHPHTQTIAPRLDRRAIEVPIVRERHELSDGDFLDLDWVGTDQTGELFILLPGMESGPDALYIRVMQRELAKLGHRSVVLASRGAVVPNRTARFYHAGHIDDLAWLVARIRGHEPRTTLNAIGFSLGGSMLIRYLAETGHSSGIRAAASVSVTFCLDSVARRACEGVNRLYQARVLRSFKRVAMEKAAYLPRYAARMAKLASIDTCRAFDNIFTGPINGFADAADYYRRSSTRQFLRHVEIPFTMINAKDDPLVARETLPTVSELGPHMTLELTRHGGHLGFLARKGSRLEYTYPEALASFFSTTGAIQ